MTPKRTLHTLVLCLIGISTLAAQDSVRVQLPDSVFGFSLNGTTTLGGTAGTAYRYQGPRHTIADVFVYAVPQERQSTPDSLQLSAEVETYVAGLASGIQQGRYDAYEIPVNTQLSVETHKGPVPSRAVVMVYRRGDQSYVSFMHLFVQHHSYVKVRLTLPATEWPNSSAPNFALELAKVLFS